MEITFEVAGIPRPGGSKKGFYIPGRNGARGHVAITETGEYTAEWREAVAFFGSMAMREQAGNVLLTGPLQVVATMVMPRPKSHYRSNGQLKPNAPKYHTSKPDATKLWRSTEDALSAIVWSDDSAIAYQTVIKLYANPGETVGASITVWQMEA